MRKKELQDYVWIQFLAKIAKSMNESGIRQEQQQEIIQELKRKCLRELPVRRNMLNMREEHIPQVQEFYNEIVNKYITSA